MLDEVKGAEGQIILFIDEMHTLIGAGKSEGAMDAGNLLKPALARGELHCIGATTLDEYRKYVEKDPALQRRFQPVFVGEPSVEDTISILRGLKEKYEAAPRRAHHRRRDRRRRHALQPLHHRSLPARQGDRPDGRGRVAACAWRWRSKPEEIEGLDRRIIQLKIEREALKKETDAASKDRLGALAKFELASWRRNPPISPRAGRRRRRRSTPRRG